MDREYDPDRWQRTRAAPGESSGGWGEQSDEHEATAAAPALAAAMDAVPTADLPETGGFQNALPLPPLPVSRAAPRPGAPQDWKKLARAEVNPRWFWRVIAAAVGVLALIVVIFALRARAVSKPAAEPDVALEQEVKERRDALEDTKKLFAAGKYAESLARARQVLARSPNNEEARKYAQMAENGLKGQQADTERKQKGAELAAAAKAALADGKDEEAKQKAEEALGLDAENAEAVTVQIGRASCRERVYVLV